MRARHCDAAVWQEGGLQGRGCDWYTFRSFGQQPRISADRHRCSGLVFSLILTIAHIFALLSGPVAKLFSSRWIKVVAKRSQFVCAELWMIVPPIFVCLIIAVTLLVPREPTQSRSAVPSRRAQSMISSDSSGQAALLRRVHRSLPSDQVFTVILRIRHYTSPERGSVLLTTTATGDPVVHSGGRLSIRPGIWPVVAKVRRDGASPLSALCSRLRVRWDSLPSFTT